MAGECFACAPAPFVASPTHVGAGDAIQSFARRAPGGAWCRAMQEESVLKESRTMQHHGGCVPLCGGLGVIESVGVLCRGKI
jgi:hypothetical protein